MRTFITISLLFPIIIWANPVLRNKTILRKKQQRNFLAGLSHSIISGAFFGVVSGYSCEMANNAGMRKIFTWPTSYCIRKIGVASMAFSAKEMRTYYNSEVADWVACIISWTIYYKLHDKFLYVYTFYRNWIPKISLPVSIF